MQETYLQIRSDYNHITTNPLQHDLKINGLSDKRLIFRIHYKKNPKTQQQRKNNPIKKLGKGLEWKIHKRPIST